MPKGWNGIPAAFDFSVPFLIAPACTTPCFYYHGKQAKNGLPGSFSARKQIAAALFTLSTQSYITGSDTHYHLKRVLQLHNIVTISHNLVYDSTTIEPPLYDMKSV